MLLHECINSCASWLPGNGTVIYPIAGMEEVCDGLFCPSESLSFPEQALEASDEVVERSCHRPQHIPLRQGNACFKMTVRDLAMHPNNFPDLALQPAFLLSFVLCLLGYIPLKNSKGSGTIGTFDTAYNASHPGIGDDRGNHLDNNWLRQGIDEGS